MGAVSDLTNTSISMKQKIFYKFSLHRLRFIDILIIFREKFQLDSGRIKEASSTHEFRFKCADRCISGSHIRLLAGKVNPRLGSWCSDNNTRGARTEVSM